MSEASITIRCPHCGHPYPMSRLQLDVYAGRSMGCMRCGRSFPVMAPAPASADTMPNLAASASQELDAVPPPARSSIAAASPALGWIGLCAAVLFVVLAAAAAVVGYADSSDSAIRMASRSQTPMILLRISFGVAAAGALVAIAGVIQIRRRRTRGNCRGPYGLVGATAMVCLSELTLASLLALTVLPALNRGLAEAHRAACQTNLQMIGYALIAGASERPDGRFPASLSELVGGGIGAETLVCPADRHATAAEGKPSYVYLGDGYTMTAGGGRRASTHTVLAYEPPGLHGDPEAFHLLFADGTVVFVEKGQAAKLLEELKALQNPPATADAIKP